MRILESHILCVRWHILCLRRSLILCVSSSILCVTLTRTYYVPCCTYYASDNRSYYVRIRPYYVSISKSAHSMTGVGTYYGSFGKPHIVCPKHLDIICPSCTYYVQITHSMCQIAHSMCNSHILCPNSLH
jgi:hypothetical protein